MREKLRPLVSLLIAGAVILAAPGCSEKAKTEPVTATAPPAAETNKTISSVVAETGKTVENAVGTAVTKTSDGIATGAQEVQRTTTNVIGEVKTGIGKFEDKLKEIKK